MADLAMRLNLAVFAFNAGFTAGLLVAWLLLVAFAGNRSPTVAQDERGCPQSGHSPPENGARPARS